MYQHESAIGIHVSSLPPPTASQPSRLSQSPSLSPLSNIGAPQYIRQMLINMKAEISNDTIIIGDFNTPLTPMDRSTKRKINKGTQTLNDTID